MKVSHPCNSREERDSFLPEFCPGNHYLKKRQQKL